jgi:plastocyanin domain-containing protein
MNKTTSIIITAGLLIAIAIVFLGQSNKDTNKQGKEEGISSVQNVEIREGVQYITINARGGYTPRVSTAEANIPTKLVMKTSGTFDCSLALVIRDICYQKILPQKGEEVIDLGTPEAGTIQGLCSMGMYNFVINFE